MLYNPSVTQPQMLLPQAKRMYYMFCALSWQNLQSGVFTSIWWLPTGKETEPTKQFLETRIWKIFQRCTKDGFQVRIPLAPKAILTNPAWSRRNSKQPRPFPKEFWTILPALEGILSNPAGSQINLEWSHPLLKEFIIIPPISNRVIPGTN